MTTTRQRSWRIRLAKKLNEMSSNRFEGSLFRQNTVRHWNEGKNEADRVRIMFCNIEPSTNHCCITVNEDYLILLGGAEGNVIFFQRF